MNNRETTGALTMRRKLIMCYEIMIARSGHGHAANEKQLPVFQRGYLAGWKDRGLHESESGKGNGDGQQAES